MSKKVYQYSNEGNFIQEFNSQTEAADKILGAYSKEANIRWSIKKEVPTGGFYWSYDKKNNLFNKDTIISKKLPKILIFDIETAPIRAFIFKIWKENVGLDQIISEWFMLSWSAKWFQEDEIMSDVLTSWEAQNEYDFRIIKSLWDLFEQADIVVAHYAKGFDVPRFKARCVVQGIMPPTPYQIIDTKEVATREFGFTSNKLDALATYFGIENKLKTNFSLWKRCLDGDEEALKEMESYNRKDVEILEHIYIKLRPYITRHPNIALYTDMNELLCPTCGSSNIVEVPSGEYVTPMNKYDVYRCLDCGAINSSRISGLTRDNRKNLLKPRSK